MANSSPSACTSSRVMLLFGSPRTWSYRTCHEHLNMSTPCARLEYVASTLHRSRSSKSLVNHSWWWLRVGGSADPSIPSHHLQCNVNWCLCCVSVLNKELQKRSAFDLFLENRHPTELSTSNHSAIETQKESIHLNHSNRKKDNRNFNQQLKHMLLPKTTQWFEGQASMIGFQWVPSNHRSLAFLSIFHPDASLIPMQCNVLGRCHFAKTTQWFEGQAVVKPSIHLSLYVSTQCDRSVVKRWLTTLDSANVVAESSRTKAQDACVLIFQF